MPPRINAEVVGSGGPVNTNSLATNEPVGNVGGPDDGKKLERPDDPSFESNVFNKELEDTFQNAGFGVTVDEVLKAKSSGQTDNQRNLKLSILREYWTLSQVNGVFILGLAFGMLITAVAFISAYDIPYFFGEQRGALTRVSGLFLGIGIAAYVGFFIPHGLKRCGGNPKKGIGFPGVDDGMEGAPCIAADDCTLSNRINSKACKYRDVSWFGWGLKWLGYLSFWVGLAIGIVTVVDNPDKGGQVCADPEPACPNGFFCKDNECEVVNSCAGDTNCPEGYICVENKCFIANAARPNDFWVSLFFGFAGGYIANYFLAH